MYSGGQSRLCALCRVGLTAMKNKGLLIALLSVASLILLLLLIILFGDHVFILKGRDGVDGVNGTNGMDGASAYELAVELGFTGTLDEWLLSLAVRGADGIAGRPGVAGVGIRDLYVSAKGELMVELTDGSLINAGTAGVGNGTSAEPDTPTTPTTPTTPATPDADGFYAVEETVVMNKPGINTLNLRAEPSLSSGQLEYASWGREYTRTGINPENGFSRFLVNGETCYAKTHYFEPKYTGQAPTVQLPASLVLVKGETTSFSTDQIIPYAGENVSLRYHYEGAKETELVNNGGEMLLLTPKAAESTKLAVTVHIFENGKQYTAGDYKIPVTVVEPNTALSKTAILIGDGRIADGNFSAALSARLPNLSYIGTLTAGAVPHEGREGWGTGDYLSEEKDSAVNPFYSSTVGNFDFGAYMQANHPTASLDVAVIWLGIHDNNPAESVLRVERMVQSIKAYDADIKVFVMSEYLSPKGGYYLTDHTNVDAMRAQQYEYLSQQQSCFGSRESEGIYLLPAAVCIDGQNDFPRTTVAIPAGNAERVTDVIHLNTEGYGKYAAMLAAYLTHVLGA